MDKCIKFEETKGREYLYNAVSKLLRLMNDDNLIVNKIVSETPEHAVVFLTGIGKVFPIVRSHNVLNNLHRQIRVSKSARMMRSYVIGMYTNEGNAHICQICKEPTQFVEAIEIANFGLELPQMHLCLCKNCASKYKSIRDNHKDDYKTKIHKAIASIDLEGVDEKFEIGINADISLTFTQTHLAEVQIFLRLIDEYGLPDDEDRDLEEVVNAHSPLGNIPRREDVAPFEHGTSNKKQKISALLLNAFV